MARIYVSSTFKDLAEYREQVRTALRSMGHDDIAMEYYGASDERPVDKCLRDVEGCELYIGVFALRYGFIPPGYEQSITELEYRKAFDKRIPCLIFLAEEASWPFSKAEIDKLSLVMALRQELMQAHTAAFFQNPDDLRARVYQAVRDWEKGTGREAKVVTDWDAYRQAVCARHQWVRLQVIAGASKERGVTRIPLTDVFEPQLVVAGTPGADVPEEVRKYQEEIYGPRRPAPEETTSAAVEEVDAIEEPIEPETDTENTLLAGNPELVLDILAQQPAQVILGGPGSGKSTVLHYAMLRLCQDGPARDTLPLHLQDAPVPFLVDLRNYVLQKAPDFVSYIVQNSLAYYDAAVDAGDLVALLGQAGRALVFFDGLDEVFDRDDRRRVLDQFQAFAHRYPQARIVVTSRIAGYDRTALGLAGFEHYTLLPLTLGQIRHFVGQWYQYYTLEGTGRTAQGLVQRIIESPRLLDLAGNPLLLTMMAVIYKDRDLPNERWRLYQRCAETLLEDWELGKGIEIEDFKLAVLVRTAQKSEILQRVSMVMLEHNQSGRELNAIAYAPLLDIVAGYLEEKYQRSRGEAEAIAVDILRHLMEHTYVLAGIGERVFGFVHRTFMEYFAACRCQALFNARKADFAWLTRDLYGAHWPEGEWEEVLLLLIAMLHDQGTPIREVVEYLHHKCRTPLPFNVAFAARCLGEAGDVQDPVAAQDLLLELARAIATYAPQTKKADAQTFVEVALKAFAILAPLVTPSPDVKRVIHDLDQVGGVAPRMAAWQMGFAGLARKDRLDYALTALRDVEEAVRVVEEAVRRGAIAALEREWPGRTDVGPALAEVVRSDRQGRVRQAALAAMQRSWRYEPAILDAIASRVDEETSYTFVIKLIDYLAASWRGNAQARDLVVRLAAPKPKARWDYDDASVIRAAAAALVQGWRSDAPSILRDWAMQHQINYVRAYVLEFILENWRDNPATLSLLQNRAVNDPDPQLRLTTLRTLAEAWRDDPATLPLLRDRAVNDPDAQIRITAVGTLTEARNDDPAILSLLRDRAVNDPVAQVRITAVGMLTEAQNDDPATLSLLQDRAVNDPDPPVRITAVGTLAHARRDDPATLSLLQDRSIKDPDRQVRARALQVTGLSWRDDLQVLAFLQDRATNDPAEGIRWLAQQVIKMVWGRDAGVVAWAGTLAGIGSSGTWPDNPLMISTPVDITLVPVPAGEFLMGSDPERDPLAFVDEQPQQRVMLPEFYIGKYPVTNAQYAVFVQATGHTAPDHWRDWSGPPAKSDHPVVNVSWTDAVDFCAWFSQATGLAFRLPGEAEWEKAARGTDGRTYPWGDDPPDRDRCNFNMNVGDTTAAGRYPAGASPYGVLDMSGNVWEWTQTKWHPDYTTPADNSPQGDAARVVRGGSFYSGERYVRCAVRLNGSLGARGDGLAFRVVTSPSHP